MSAHAVAGGPSVRSSAHAAHSARSAWEQKQKRELLIEYALRSPDDSGSHITLSPKTFSLGFSGWFAVLQPPIMRCPFPTRPDKTVVRFECPLNFWSCREALRSATKSSGAMETRYMLRVKDLAPFVVGGQYVEASSSRGGKISVVFWTFEPLKQDTAASGQQFESAPGTRCRIDFGPLDRTYQRSTCRRIPRSAQPFDRRGGSGSRSFSWRSAG